jgi:hypothetical protein
VCLGSSRQGGLDVSFLGLATQTYKDAEYLFVDDRYFLRHAQVHALAKDLGLDLIHVPNARYSGDDWAVTSAGFNTEFMLSAGEIVIMLMDYAHVEPDWIEQHVRAFDEGRRFTMGPHQYYELPWDRVAARNDGKPFVRLAGNGQCSLEDILEQREQFPELSLFKEPYSPAWFSTLPRSSEGWSRPTGPGPRELMDTKNNALPLDVVLDVNGMDEHYDSFCGPGDSDFGRRLCDAGLEPYVVSEALIRAIDPRSLLANQRWCTTNETGVGTMKPMTHGTAYYASTQYLKRANNPYDLRERRKEIWWWRDAGRQPGTLIHRNVVRNEEYFK